MNIFDKDRVGAKVWCLLEKDGENKEGLIKWHNAIEGNIVNGWTVLQVDINHKIIVDYL